MATPAFDDDVGLAHAAEDLAVQELVAELGVEAPAETAPLSWGGKGLTLIPGALLVAGASLAWGVDNNVTRQISAADPVMIFMLKVLGQAQSTEGSPS